MDGQQNPDSVDVARAAPPPVSVINRRALVLTGFWGSNAAVAAAIVGGWGIDFLWPKKLAGFGTPVDVKASKVPAPSATGQVKQDGADNPSRAVPHPGPGG